MRPMQLGGSIDSTVFGIPLGLVLMVGGLLALAAGVLLRIQIEGVRRSEPGAGDSPMASGVRVRTERRRTNEGDRDRTAREAHDRGAQVDGDQPGDAKAGRPGGAERSTSSEPTSQSGEPGAPTQVDDTTPFVDAPSGSDVDGGSYRSSGHPGDGPIERLGADELPGLLVTASERLAEGEFDGSIQAAYMFVRRELSAELDTSTDGTHWDFFRECVDAGLAEREDVLRELTEAYEKAVFGSRPATEHEAERALERSGELTGVTLTDRR